MKRCASRSSPWFAGKPSHPFVPLGRGSAGARSEGQGRSTAGALRAPFTAASTLARLARSGVGSALALTILLLLPGVGPVAASAQDVLLADRAPAHHPYAGYVADAARRFGIPEAWIWAVMRVESNGDARAVSTAGAMGLMQIMPATWGRLRARYGFGADPFDVRDNIMAGTAYLREMHDRYGDAHRDCSQPTNAGTGRTDDYLSRGRPLPAETRAYLGRLASITGGAAILGLPPRRFPIRWPGVAPRCSCAWRVRRMRCPASSPVAEFTASASAPEPPSVSPATDSSQAVPQREAAPADTLFRSRARAGRPQ